MLDIEKLLIEKQQKDHGQSMEHGFDFAMTLAIDEIKEVRDHWQKRLQPDPHSKKQGLEDDSLVYFEFTKMVLESLIYRFQEQIDNIGKKHLGD
jgi:hypothetical protein